MDYLVHHGIKGQKWGVRRYQNPDGTLTVAGKARYSTYDRPQSEGNPYSARQTAKVHKKAENLDAAAKKWKEKANWFSEARFNSAADSYLSATKDEAYKTYKRQRDAAATVGALTLGYPGSVAAVVAWEATPAGTKSLQAYESRKREVMNKALETAYSNDAGKEFVDGLIKDSAKRPDRY